MIVRLVSIVCFSITLVSCAHLPRHTTPQQQVASNISTSFVRVHTYSTYEMYQCEEAARGCVPIGMQITTTGGVASGGIVKHYDDYTIVLTAQHVVSRFNTSPRPSSNVIRAFSEIMGMPYDEVLSAFQAGLLVAHGINTSITVVASDGAEYPINGIRCHDSLDTCFAKTSSRINGIEPLVVAETSPSVGDIVTCAQAPFGYAIPGLMVPIFMGIYSGHTPEAQGETQKDYYTFPVAPGSSGSLIVNDQGQVIGLVTAFMYGPLCMGNSGCQILSSGITTSVPHADIQEFFNHLLTSNQESK